jgi:3-hydroxyisobutyrate dehydrogenase-like beta-hydroxyacid dehydrogenase
VEAIGFVGFGEAAFHIAKGLRGAGVPNVVAFDINTHTPKLGDLIRARAAETKTHLVDSNSAVAAACEVIFSAVTADQALMAAQQTAPHLVPEHCYADLNSVSPQMKQRIGCAISASGARFVEAAMMGPVPPHSHKVSMLLGGAAAPAFLELLRLSGFEWKWSRQTRSDAPRR